MSLLVTQKIAAVGSTWDFGLTTQLLRWGTEVLDLSFRG